LRGPHQLHRHGQGGPRVRPRRPRRPQEHPPAAQRLQQPGRAAAEQMISRRMCCASVGPSDRMVGSTAGRTRPEWGKMNLPDLNTMTDQTSALLSGTGARRARKRMPWWVVVPVSAFFYGLIGAWLWGPMELPVCGWLCLAGFVFECLHFLVHLA